MKDKHIRPIEKGTALDHLPAGSAMKVMQLLDLDYSREISIAMNVESKKKGKKDLVFIENKFLTPKEINRIALIAEGATLNTIERHEVKKKELIELPSSVQEILSCMNPNCITNKEEMKTKFSISKNPLRAKCFYCEKTMNGEEINKSIK